MYNLVYLMISENSLFCKETIIFSTIVYDKIIKPNEIISEGGRITIVKFRIF